MTDAVTTRFNAGVAARREYARWKLRTERWDGRSWVTLATFPPVTDDYQRELQRERLQRHADAFGGLVRLMRGELLLAAWEEGRLTCDLREEAA